MKSLMTNNKILKYVKDVMKDMDSSIATNIKSKNFLKAKEKSPKNSVEENQIPLAEEVQPFNQKIILIDGKELVVQNDIEKYLMNLAGGAVKALTDLQVYQDLSFKVKVNRVIAKGEIFMPTGIEVSEGGTPRFRVEDGYVTANKKSVEPFELFPLVSIVVPIYNVEKYLELCLLSIQNQTYQNLEIICVNDGSPDNSVQIAERFSAEDPRFKVHTQENGGLSAARNTGIRLATGKLIWFIDSDDTVAPNAVSLMVESLQKTGSDFVVGCYRRMNSSGYKNAGPWIQEAHIENQYNITLEENPGILVNATAWNKLVRYDFLVKNELYFPVGVLYEDQLWSTKLYSSAQSFDILKDVIYDWRVRDDNSSISQQSKDVENVGAILTAIQNSLDELYKRELKEVAYERAVQFLSNNMREYISYLDYTDEAYMERLSEGLISITKDLPLSKWENVPAHIAAIEWLLIQKDFDRVREFVEVGGRNTNTMVATYIKDDVILKVPYWDDPEVNFPKEVLTLKENQYNANVELRRAYWLNQDELYLEGWAFLPLVDPVEVENPAKLTLISDEEKPHYVEIKLESYMHPQLDRVSGHQLNDYRPFGFRAVLNIDQLNLHHKANYKFQFTLTIGSIQRIVDLTNVALWGAAGKVRPSTSSKGIGVRVIHKVDQPLLLNIEKKDIFARDICIDQDKIILNLESKVELAAIQIVTLDQAQKPINKFLFNNIFKLEVNNYQCVLDIDDLPINGINHWLVRGVDCKGTAYVIAWPYFIDQWLEIPVSVDQNKIALFESDWGNLGLRKLPPSTLHITALEQTKQGIKITACLLGDKIHKVSAQIFDHRHSIQCTVKRLENNKLNILIPFYAKHWNKQKPLASGRYRLDIKNSDASIKISFATNVLSALPQWLNEKAPIVARLERHPKQNYLIMVVQPSVPLQQQGARNRNQYILEHQHGEYKIDPQIVFFRTYYGESTTCCALGIHQELFRRNNQLKLYWSVKDTSVLVPEGGIPVVEGSKAWFEIYSRAKYIIDNTHHPDFFEKREGQVIIATFHGYPFKQAGIPYWESHGFSKARIESFLRRHEQWDYLLSPAPYATPILEEVFPSSTAKTIELGYPRNDIFFSPMRNRIRKDIRKTLGLKQNQIAILYAPTYRDNLSQDEFKAKMIDFLDLERLTQELGKDYVVLVRGHMINARVDERVEIASKQIIDVTDYPEISDLCLASDVGILDYSSLRFDYTMTNNPMIFFVPDLEDYLYDIRGSLVPYEETAPGPFARDTDNVIYWVQHLDQLKAEYAEQRQTFIDHYMPLEDGKASQRFVDEVFKL